MDVVNTIGNWLGILGTLFVVISLLLIYWTSSESSRRSESKSRTLSDESIINKARLAEAEKKLEHSRRLVAQIEAKQADRRITDEQKADFIAALKDVRKRRVEISGVRYNDEADSYQNDLARLLKDSGFAVTNDMQSSVVGLTGLRVLVNNAVPSVSDAIISAFKLIGIQTKVFTDAQADCDIRIQVGYKSM